MESGYMEASPNAMARPVFFPSPTKRMEALARKLAEGGNQEPEEINDNSSISSEEDEEDYRRGS